MDYQRLYDKLIRNARHRYAFGASERHHVIPRSMGGTDDWENLVRVSPKLHALLHLILYRLGNRTQIFSVWLIVEHHGMRKKKWLRKWKAREEARVIREANRRRLGIH